MKRVGRERVVPGEGLEEGVDRRGTDVAIDHADRADGELVERTVDVAALVGENFARRRLCTCR